MLQRVCLRSLWISTIIVLVLFTIQGWSGNWVTFFLAWPSGPGDQLSNTFLQFMSGLSVYHVKMGFAIGAISVLISIFAFLSKSSIYVRTLAVIGLAITTSAAMGGFLYVSSGFQDRWSLGQMADAFVGVLGAYFIQLYFMGKGQKSR